MEAAVPTSSSTAAKLISKVQTNLNVSWLANPYSWAFYIACIGIARWAVYAFTPHAIVDTSMQWTITHFLHGLVSFFALHMAYGSPIWSDQGDFIHDTVWEQIDNSIPWTDARKVLFVVPILLFIVTMNYAGYDASWETALNVIVLVVTLVPKLPEMHHVRLCRSRPHYGE